MSCFSASLWSALSRSLTSTPPEEEMQTPMVAEGGDRGDGGREQGVLLSESGLADGRAKGEEFVQELFTGTRNVWWSWKS